MQIQLALSQARRKRVQHSLDCIRSLVGAEEDRGLVAVEGERPFAGCILLAGT
jgi:hypothetical protein